MLGDVIELSVVVKDIDEAIERYAQLFGLTVHHRGESKEFGFMNAILPTGIGHIELLQPTDPNKAVGQVPREERRGRLSRRLRVQGRRRRASRKLRAEGARVDQPRGQGHRVGASARGQRPLRRAAPTARPYT